MGCGRFVVVVGWIVMLVGKLLELEVMVVNFVVVELVLDFMECCDLLLVIDLEIVVKIEGGLLIGWVMDGKIVLIIWLVVCVGVIEDVLLGFVEDFRILDEMMECWEVWFVEESEVLGDFSLGEIEGGVEVVILESCVVIFFFRELFVWNGEWGVVFFGKEFDIELFVFWRFMELLIKEFIIVCVDVFKSNEVFMFVRVFVVDVFND